MDSNLISVEVRTRDGVIFEGECRSVTSYNVVGRFDILPLHANFISLIQQEVILVTAEGETRQIGVDNGLCRVKENKVKIFLPGLFVRLRQKTSAS